MPKWWQPTTLGNVGVICVAGPAGREEIPIGLGSEGARRARRMKAGGGCGSPWRLAGTSLSVAEATRVGPALGVYSVSRVNPIFVDEDFTFRPRQRPQYSGGFHRMAPESPGKSGSSGYESNPCSDEAYPARRDDSRQLRASAPRRAAASRAARRQACSVHRQNVRNTDETVPGRTVEGDSDEGYARLPLAPIPEGRIGGPLRVLGDVPRTFENAGDSPASYSPASTASSSPASSSSSSSGKRLLKRADAAILLWGHPRTGAGTSHTMDSGDRRLLRESIKGSACPSPSSSAASTVSSGSTIPVHRGTVLPDTDGVDGGLSIPADRTKSGAPSSEKDVKLPSEAPAEGVQKDKQLCELPSGSSNGPIEGPWGSLLPPQFIRHGVSEDAVPNALKNAMLYGTLYRIKAGGDAYEKLRALGRDGTSGEVRRDVEGQPWGRWDFGGGPVVSKDIGASSKLQAPRSPVPSIASSKSFTGTGHADFTLDMPRAERLMRQIAAAKRRRCWGRFAAATFALAFFLISVVAVSMLCTRGKRVFGPL